MITQIFFPVLMALFPAAYQPPASSQNYHCDPAPEPVRQAAAASPPSSGVSLRFSR